MRLFPRWHTPESVAREIIDGLRDGTVTLEGAAVASRGVPRHPHFEQLLAALASVEQRLDGARRTLDRMLIECVAVATLALLLAAAHALFGYYWRASACAVMHLVTVLLARKCLTMKSRAAGLARDCRELLAELESLENPPPPPQELLDAARECAGERPRDSLASPSFLWRWLRWPRNVTAPLNEAARWLPAKVSKLYLPPPATAPN